MLLSIAKLASKHGIAPLKKFGQNFIFDESLCDKIVQYSKINQHSCVVEVGPGPAGLTRSILKAKPQKLTVIETDSRCIPLLEELQEYYPFLKIQHNDALKIDLESLAYGAKLDLVSNLPYNIGSQLLIRWINQIKSINSMTLMLQKEVVDRIVSNHNKKSYGRLSVICQVTCDVHRCFDVSPKAFYPEPKIWSSIVRLIPKADQPSEKILNQIEKITQLAFSGRRKMIKSSLKTLHANIEDILYHLGIDPKNRAENLSPEDYLNIAENFV